MLVHLLVALPGDLFPAEATVMAAVKNPATAATKLVFNIVAPYKVAFINYAT